MAQTGPVVGWLPHDIYANMPYAGMMLSAGISARLTRPATSAYLSPIYCANAAPVCYSVAATGRQATANGLSRPSHNSKRIYDGRASNAGPRLQNNARQGLRRACGLSENTHAYKTEGPGLRPAP